MSRNRSLPSDFLILSSVSCDPLAMTHYLTVVVSAAGKEAKKEVPEREVVKEVLGGCLFTKRCPLRR